MQHSSSTYRYGPRMRILVIDDDKTSVQQLLDELDDLADFEWEYCGFSDTQTTLSRFKPGIVVLDLILDSPGTPGIHETPGVEIFDTIWSTLFGPLVIYSAQPDQVAEAHPLVAKVQKGSGSELEVVERLRKFLIPAQALDNAQAQANTELRRAFQRVSPKVPHDDADLLYRVTMRQFAAVLDVQIEGTTLGFAWEQFIYPPVHEHLATGDVLRIAGGDPATPQDHRIILTPTCDLVYGDDRDPKVKSVLVSKCEGIPATFPKKTKLVKLLTSGFDDGTSSLVMPGFLDVLPPMLANLKSLEMIDLNTIAQDESVSESKFYRVTSIDSPFREMATWAYLQVAGTPGLPDRNLKEWAKTIDNARES